jgi:VCBS repeat-containing protein
MKIAIIGAGAMGKVHAKGFSTITDCKVVAVVDNNEKAGRPLAEELGCGFYCDTTTLKQLSPDIVDICLPTHLHYSTIVETSEFCKSIICEKPLTTSKNELTNIKAIVESKDLNFMVAHVLKFFKGYLKVKRFLDEGRIGTPTSIICKRRSSPPGWTTDNWFFDERKSGGLLFDLIVHDIDFLVWLFGQPQEVAATASYQDGVSRHMNVLMIYDNFFGSVFGSWGMPAMFSDGGGFASSLEITGSHGMVTYNSKGKFEYTTDNGKETEVINESDAYADELRYFVQCVRNCEKPVISDIYSAENTFDVLDRIRDSLSMQNDR